MIFINSTCFSYILIKENEKKLIAKNKIKITAYQLRWATFSSVSSKHSSAPVFSQFVAKFQRQIDSQGIFFMLQNKSPDILQQ